MSKSENCTKINPINPIFKLEQATKNKFHCAFCMFFDGIVYAFHPNTKQMFW